MNASHAAVAGISTAFTAYLTTILTGYHGLDAAHAAAWSGLCVTLIGAVYALIAWWVKWRWPSAPPLPEMSIRERAVTVTTPLPPRPSC